jgi:membrane protein implicated in regulation of membrane protease activity
MIKELFQSEKLLLILAPIHLVMAIAVVMAINWQWSIYFVALALLSAATYFVNDRFIPQGAKYAFKRKTTK